MSSSNDIIREFTGIWIPKEIWETESLSKIEKLFWAEIEALDGEKGCFASNAYFAKFFKITEVRCSNIINSLIKKELIYQKSFNGKQRILKSRLKEKFKADLKKSLSIDNNKEKVLSKDNTERFSGKTGTFKPSIYLEKWNSLKNKNILIQQHLNPDRNVYQRAVKLIKHLKNGTFGNHVHVDRDFMKKNHVRFLLLEKKWTDKEIFTCLDRLSLLFKEGYWPPRKNLLPKSLADLIHNPRTNASWFLLVYTHPPRPVNQEKTDEETKNEIKYKTTGTITMDEVMKQLEEQDQRWIEEEKKREKERKKEAMKWIEPREEE